MQPTGRPRKLDRSIYEPTQETYYRKEGPETFAYLFMTEPPFS